MEDYSPQAELKLVKGSKLDAVHDKIFSSLDYPEKAEIIKLLSRNNNSFKKVLYTYLVANQYKNIPELMMTLDKLLDAHARECYTIGFLDSLKP